ncbi:hypothetical protein PCE1_002471 [Barthelona sp. PCE]
MSQDINDPATFECFEDLFQGENPFQKIVDRRKQHVSNTNRPKTPPLLRQFKRPRIAIDMEEHEKTVDNLLSRTHDLLEKAPDMISLDAQLTATRFKGRTSFLNRIKVLQEETNESKYVNNCHKIIEEQKKLIVSLQSNIEERDRALLTRNLKINEMKENLHSLTYKSDLLRTKLSKQNQRMIGQERKLNVFGKLQPILETLSKKFMFNSPEEIIQRIETLERLQKDSVQQIQTLQERNGSLEQKLKMFYSDNILERKEEQISTLKTRMEATEKENTELQQRLKMKDHQITKLFNQQEESRILYFSLVNLWQQWRDVEDVWIADLGIDTDHKSPDLTSSLQIINEFSNVLTQLSPSKSAKYIREFAALATKAWRVCFPDEDELYGQPTDIFEALINTVSKNGITLESHIRRIKTLEDENGTLKNRLEQLQRSIRATEARDFAKTTDYIRTTKKKGSNRPKTSQGLRFNSTRRSRKSL